MAVYGTAEEYERDEGTSMNNCRSAKSMRSAGFRRLPVDFCQIGRYPNVEMSMLHLHHGHHHHAKSVLAAVSGVAK
jgi:hypothetical protein